MWDKTNELQNDVLQNRKLHLDSREEILFIMDINTLSEGGLIHQSDADFLYLKPVNPFMSSTICCLQSDISVTLSL